MSIGIAACTVLSLNKYITVGENGSRILILIIHHYMYHYSIPKLSNHGKSIRNYSHISTQMLLSFQKSAGTDRTTSMRYTVKSQAVLEAPTHRIITTGARLATGRRVSWSVSERRAAMLTPSSLQPTTAASGQDTAMASHGRLKEEWHKISYTAATRSHALTNYY